MKIMSFSWLEKGINHSQNIDPNDISNKKKGSFRIGRDYEICDLILDDPKVSRLHIEISFNQTQGQFYIQNLKDNNPIQVDSSQLRTGSQNLHNGSVIRLGDTQIEVSITELDLGTPKRNPPKTAVTIGQFLPILKNNKELKSKGLLLPGIVTVISVILLFSSIRNSNLFNLILAGYLSFVGFYSIYRLCNKPKSWWVLLIPVIMIPLLFITGVFNLLSLFFRDFILGHNALANIPETFLPAFIFFFFAAGLQEELFKAIPVFIMGWLGKAVKDPIDGILLGAASGVGFTLVETLGEYIPKTIQTGGDLSGLQLLIPRILASVFGHMAYSGIFGYYIGLSFLKPKKAWQLLPLGYLISATVHALWDSSSTLGTSGLFVLAIVGTLTYVLLMTAILKAREISGF